MSIGIITALVVLFLIDIYYIYSLYMGVKAQTEAVVSQCLERADIQEMLIRVSKVNNTTTDTIQIRIPLIYKKTDSGRKIPNYDWLGQEMFVDSTGYYNVHRQFIRVLSRNMHEDLDHTDFPPDTVVLDSLLRVELKAQGLFPKYVHVSRAKMTGRLPRGSMWEVPLSFCTGGKVFYYAYISGLDSYVLRQMKGILGISLAIILMTSFALTYLLLSLSKLKTIEQMKDDFINNMTHELKTPISIAVAANDSLLNSKKQPSEQRIRKYLLIGNEQLSKLTSIVENILAMSRERRRNVPLTFTRIKAVPFVEEIAATLRLKSGKECEITVSGDPEIEYKIDAFHFGNVVSNLIDNAIKYSGDSVTVEVIMTRSNIEVRDNGIGIPRKYQPYIFDKFYRVDCHDTHDVKGLGIGLYYTKNILQQMNWSIRVESQPGKGSVFILTYRNHGK